MGLPKFSINTLFVSAAMLLTSQSSFADFNLIINQSVHHNAISLKNNGSMYYGLTGSSESNLGFEYLWKSGASSEMVVGLGQYNRTIDKLKPDYSGNPYFNMSPTLPISSRYLYFHYNQYFLNQIYGIVGFNYNMPSATWANSVASPDTSSQFGYEVGVGYKFLNSFRVEGIYQVLNSAYIAGTDHPAWASQGTKIPTSSSEFSFRLSYRLF